MIKKVYNSRGFQTALPWIIFLIGIGLFIYSYIGNFETENSKWKEFYKIIGQTFLASGIFAVMLKSMQFMGVFREELIKLIYEPKALENRVDLSEFWQKVSVVLFRNKFPKISDKLLKDVKEIYLPTQEVSYYENAEHTLDIKIIDKVKKTVKLTDTVIVDVVCESVNTKTMYEFGYTKDAADYVLKKFKVDGNDKPIHTIEEKKSNNKTFEVIKTKLNGKERYTIEKVAERTYYLDEDDVFLFRAKKIFHKLKIQIHYDPDIKIVFSKGGTLADFKLKKQNENFEEHICEGLIYPEQGYHIIIKMK